MSTFDLFKNVTIKPKEESSSYFIETIDEKSQLVDIVLRLPQ